MAVVGQADISRLSEALRRTAHDSGITTHQVLIQSANQILAEMESRVPVKSGTLRHSLRIEVGTDRVIIGPNVTQAPYASYVEFGTKPHTIKPRKPGGMLVFTINGKKVYARVVHHPGTQPNPFVQQAFEAWVDSLGRMAAEANIKVFKDAANA